MTHEEKLLAAALLELAAESYSNHGCNDFDLVPYLGSAAARDRLVEECYGELFPQRNDSSDYRIGDWELMELMAKKLRAEAAS